MNLLDFDQYEKLSAEDCWCKYGWGSEAKPQSIVLHLLQYDYEVFVDEMIEEYSAAEEDVYGCEIFDGSDMVGQWFDKTPAQAVMGACVSAVGHNVMRAEDNCEDAVNGCAYEAYQMALGETALCDVDREVMDEFLGVARRFVQNNVKWVDYGWEEF